MIVGSDEREPDKQIIKAYDKTSKNLTWLQNVETNTMRVVIRISRNPEKYDFITYVSNRNYFTVSRTGRQLGINEMMNILCSHLGIGTLTLPTVSSSTYSFVTNYMEGARGGSGIDRSIIASVIRNPPAPYTSTGIGNYVFIKEDTRPNALREHVSIHIQLGTEKMYLSFSQHETTAGTLVPKSMGQENGEPNLVGFEKGQRYTEVRINKCPSMAYARICQSLYLHIMNMYLSNHERVYNKALSIGVLISIARNVPRIVPLREREPTEIEKYAHVDPILYSHLTNIKPSLLPIPITRDQVDFYRG